MVRRIFLLRHAESVANKEHVLAGWTDVKLSENGIKQAKGLSEILGGYKFDHIYCSDLVRARDTLELVGAEGDITYSKELRERNHGIWEGRKVEELTGNSDFDNNIFEKLEGGESLEEVQKRVSQYFKNEILDKDYENILIVSHFWPIIMLSCYLLDYQIENARSIKVTRCSLSLILKENGRYKKIYWNIPKSMGDVLKYGDEKFQ